MSSFKYSKRYQRAHKHNPKWFSGKMGLETADNIARLVSLTSAVDILDYGSGKGYQYLKDRIHERWGLKVPYCYDPGVRQLMNKPKRKFDGVICCDVLEHIHREDVDSILNDIFSYVVPLGFVYLGICCRPAHKEFEDGINVHLTVEHPDWWREKITMIKPATIIVEEEYEYIRGYYVEPERMERLHIEDG